ncbi:MAG: tetrahydrofolate dehydrogenase/cyclohydrolase catalytic domain-containing protein [Thiolinea sp.]
MTAVVLDGKALSKELEAGLSERVARLRTPMNGQTPILATILVGDDPSSATYVQMKGNACRRVGMDSIKVLLDSDTTTAQLQAEIEKLNANPLVHGILLQHPVPEQIDERACFDSIAWPRMWMASPPSALAVCPCRKRPMVPRLRRVSCTCSSITRSP